MKRAVFPGSFDPITLGHIDIIKRAIPLFDEIIVAIGVNADKKYMFSLDDRLQHLSETFKNSTTIKVATYSGLTVDFCKKEEARFILRGLRNATDFTYEQSIAQTNYKLAGIESVFLVCTPEYAPISSSIVRDVIRNGGDFTKLVPRAVLI
ncbi:MAG: pantetheine-phosphate adenylyltransferase [Flavobacteriales bacterium]